MVADLASIDRHHIESMGGFRCADRLKIRLRSMPPSGGFGASDAFFGETPIATLLHLDEDDQTVIEGNQVEFATARRVAAGHQRVATFQEELRGSVFGLVA
jgi:hypothetical protein